MDTLVAQPPPLRIDEQGVVRVGNTRIPIDRVVAAYDAGESAEEIVSSYPSLSIEQVQAVIAYSLGNRERILDYLEQRNREAEEIRRKVEERIPSDRIRNLLIERRNKT